MYVSGLGVYGNVGKKIVNESFPYNPDTEFASIRLKAQRYLEENCNQLGIRFAVVHFGDVYGPGGWFYNFLIQRLLKNMFRFPKGGDYYKGFIHVEDAVGSLVSILKKNKNEGKFIVTDSHPTKFKEFVNHTADSIGVKHPGDIPVFIARALLGGDLMKLLTTSMTVTKKKISEIYEFKFPSYKEGIAQVISDLKLKQLL